MDLMDLLYTRWKKSDTTFHAVASDSNEKEPATKCMHVCQRDFPWTCEQRDHLTYHPNHNTFKSEGVLPRG